MSSGAATAAGRRRAAARSGASGRPRKPAGQGRPAARGASRSRRPASRPRSRTAAPASWRARAIVAGALLLTAVAGYFAWFRDSSLVAINDVSVRGVASADSGQITAALTRAAEGMTTLHVRDDELAAAVEGFPTVASVRADPSFPHGLTVYVTEREPAVVAIAPTGQVAVARDGTLLPGLPVDAERDLPSVRVDALPGSPRLTGEALEQAVVVGSAPEPLRRLIERVAISGDLGVVVTLRGGIPVRFGTSAHAAGKWAAAAAVLADPEIQTLTYVDVRVPERPAAGGAAPAEEPADPALAPPATEPDAVATAPPTAPTG